MFATRPTKLGTDALATQKYQGHKEDGSGADVPRFDPCVLRSPVAGGLLLCLHLVPVVPQL